jgi:ribosome-interacting GTPase 1
MKNSLINFEFKEYDTINGIKVLQDYTSKYFGGLQEIFRDNSEYFTYINIENDEKLENIAYFLYGNENYADIIMLVNEMDMIWGTPYNQDILLDYNDVIMNYFYEELNIEPENLTALQARILDHLDLANSKKRTIRIPKIEFLPNVIKLIKNFIEENNEENWKINQLEYDEI